MNPNTDTAVVTINSDAVHQKSGTKNGKDWSIREQEATIETADRRQPIRLDLGTEPPHAPGKYLLRLVPNLNISQFGSVQFKRRLQLERIEENVAKKVA